MKIKIGHKVVLFIIVLVGLLIAVLTFFQADEYADFSKAKASPEQAFQIIVNIDKTEDIILTPDSLVFWGIDNLGNKLEIIHFGAINSEFKKTEKAVVKGQYVDNRFVAKELLLKCPSKYAE